MISARFEGVLRMKDLQETRQALDAVDRQLVALLEQRMTLARDVAAYKLSVGMPVLDRSREAQVLESRCAMLQDPHWEDSVRTLYETIMALSRAEQERLMKEARHA